ncbi:hypothetical protein AIJ61_20540, partial [Salmonella enterica subsp. enterica serovar Enteritidis]
VIDVQPWPAGVRAQAVSPDGNLIDDFLFVTTRVAPVAIDKGLLAEQGRVVKLHNCFLSEGLTGKCGV